MSAFPPLPPQAEPKAQVWRIILFEVDRQTGAKSVKDIIEHSFSEINPRTGRAYSKTQRRRAFEWIADVLDEYSIERQDEYSIERMDEYSIERPDEEFC